MPKTDVTAYRLNPSWLAAFSVADPTTAQQPTARDLAVVLEVAGRLSARAPDGADLERHFAEELREHAEGRSVLSFRDVWMKVSELREGFGFRTAAEAEVCLRRLARAELGGERLFERVERIARPKGDDVAFVMAANGALARSHVSFASKRDYVPKDYRHYPYPDRHYAEVAPALMATWSSAASVPIATRLTAWLRSPCRTGLPRGRHEFDARGALNMSMTSDDVVGTLGFALAEGRRSPARYDEIFERVAVDLMLAGLGFRWSWVRGYRTVHKLVVDAWLATKDERLAAPWARGKSVMLRGSAPAATARPAAPEQVEDSDVAPPPVVEPPAAVPVAVTTSRPGRVRLPGMAREPSALTPVLDAPNVEAAPSVTPADPVVAPHTDGIASLSIEAILARPLGEYTPEDIDAMTDAQRDALRDREIDESDPWYGVPGYEGTDALTGEPLFDEGARDLARYWYPGVAYPITSPSDPSMMLTLERPARPNEPAQVRMEPETHRPSPDPDRCQHRHPWGVWGSDEYEESRTRWRDGDVQDFLVVPGDATARWVTSVEQLTAVIGEARALHRERERQAAAGRPPISATMLLVRQARDLRGYDVDDDTHDHEFIDALLD